MRAHECPGLTRLRAVPRLAGLRCVQFTVFHVQFMHRLGEATVESCVLDDKPAQLHVIGVTDEHARGLCGGVAGRGLLHRFCSRAVALRAPVDMPTARSIQGVGWDGRDTLASRAMLK
jgi:hypothetical protein